MNIIDQYNSTNIDNMIFATSFAHSNVVRKIDKQHVLVRTHKKDENKVALFSGGGSGHEPAHGGYVGAGLLDAAVYGHVFTSPSPDQILAAIRNIYTPQGVLAIIKNYSGDILNFNIAMEQAKKENLLVDSIVVGDDIASKAEERFGSGRGVAGTIFYHKILGQAAERGMNLEELKAIAARISSRIASLGVCFTEESVEDQRAQRSIVHIGVGIHGEPAPHQKECGSVGSVLEEMLQQLLENLEDTKEKRIAVLINGLGNMSLIELYNIFHELSEKLYEENFEILYPLIGEYMTSLNMRGFFITILKLDDELSDLLYSDCESIALTQKGFIVPNQTQLREDEKIIDVKNLNVENTLVGKSSNQQSDYNIDDVVSYFQRVSKLLSENADHLNHLDTLIGDGDHGYNMKIGFDAVNKMMQTKRYKSIEEILRDVGMTILSKVGGASGALYGMGFIEAAQVMKEKQTLNMQDIYSIIIAIANEIAKRGECQVGDKTIIDTLSPAATAFSQEMKLHKSNMEVFKAVYGVAEEAMENTKNIIAKKGRASYVGEKNIGVADPGASSCALFFQALIAKE